MVADGVAIVPEGRRLFTGMSVEDNLRVAIDHAAPPRAKAGRSSASIALFPILKEKQRRAGADRFRAASSRWWRSAARCSTSRACCFATRSASASRPRWCARSISPFRRSRSNGTAVVLVEQDVGLAQSASDRLYCMLEGRVTLTGDSADMSPRGRSAKPISEHPMQWLDGLVQGVLLGGLYAQYALGMALMFGVMRIVNITHGDLMILLSLIGISLASTFALGPWSVLVDPGARSALSSVWLLQRLILNRVVGADPLPSLIATFGLSVALQNAMLQIWSADTRSLPSGGIAQASFQIGPLFVGVLPVIVLVHRDRADRRARRDAALHALRPGAARGVGRCRGGGDDRRQPQERLCRGDGGRGRRFSALRPCSSRCGRRSRPPMAPYQLIYAFEAVIIGGMGSIWGAFIGAMVLGISQSIGFRIDPGFGILAGHLVFLIILALRPQGLFGKD